MSAGTSQKIIENYLGNLLQANNDVFLVEVTVSQSNHVLVFLDAHSGITIEKCINVNRALYKQIEENSVFVNNDFSLEVSSAGVGEPLKLLRQYSKNIGRMVEVLFNDDTKKEGKLFAIDSDAIIIEEVQGKGKKAVSIKTNILFNQIKHTKVLVTF